jgi:methyl-accepting chemotaxis protein
MAFLSIQKKILFSLVALTLFFGLAMVVFAETVIQRKLVEQLRQKGAAIARRVAADCVSPIITGRTFEVTMMFRDLQSTEEDIVYAFVLSEEGRVLAHTFAGGVPADLRNAHPVDPLVKSSARELSTDRGPVLDIAVPLLRGQIGVLHLGLSETAIRKDVNGIVLLIVAFALATLLVGSVAAVGFSRVITRPLLKLAGAAEAFGREGRSQPLAIESEDEVGDLARVFNEMVENRMRVKMERERLIEELQKALSEVKTLRGFLPICSSCKKIRSDQGSWQQIESYIRDHSDAEFSHGICPDCAKALYPDQWAKIQDRGEVS